ncbi:general stress protein [Brucella intermedia]|uniref:general stress protein n=1 Tax=Brucella intermedia TaxID=94625 RepID=UPI000DDC5E9B|nr:KGG domain-containing protein [Brucella intermedia]MCB4921013.1 stress-induced protein [Brucella intermedia]UXO85214.1 stress-induced protein [Brucella intermedia]
MADQTANCSFASSADKQREIASNGGQASGGNVKTDPARAADVDPRVESTGGASLR